MATDLIMPQMGESIAEGTIARWMKAVGDPIEKDEPILEISTDKVDAEIPSPVGGTLIEVLYSEGDTVEVGTVIGRIGEAGETTAAPRKKSKAARPKSAKAAAAPSAPAPSPEPAPPAAAGAEGPTDVIMPQMGESIAEGTIARWMKAVGDLVGKDEPILEISTDKVDAEIPSPVEGKLIEILHQEGETVEVGTIIARIAGSAAAAASASPAKAVPSPTPQAAKAAEPKPAKAMPKPVAPAATGAASTREERIRTLSSPVVRKIAKEQGIDITRVPGPGIHGRVTKKDILGFIESGAAAAPPPAAVSTSAAAPEVPEGVAFAPGEGTHVEPLSIMRRKIAEHMVMSRRTSAHVQTVFEVDMSRIAAVRESRKKAFLERNGAKLTYTPFFARAAVHALRKLPVVNASLDGNDVVYKREVNLGIAVALDWGLIVPVVKAADGMNIVGLSRAIQDLATRAREKRLTPEEVQGGTFTLTNPGPFGALFGLPIINQPQVGIMGIGNIQKRPVVVNDAIAIRPMVYLSLSFDHRLVDGAVADQFMAQVKWFLENNDWERDVG